MSSEHTPGPWEVRESAHQKTEIVEAESGEVVLYGVGDWGYEGDLCSTPENLTLIASAPDMRAALDRIATITRGVVSGHARPEAAIIEIDNIVRGVKKEPDYAK